FISLQLPTILSPTTPCISIFLLTVLARDRSRIFRSPFSGGIPFLASSLESRLANASGRIEFIIVLFMDWSFASGCSPPRLSTTQLPSATDRPVLLSDGDFHPTLGAYFQAHFPRPFGPPLHFASMFSTLSPLTSHRLPELFLASELMRVAHL